MLLQENLPVEPEYTSNNHAGQRIERITLQFTSRTHKSLVTFFRHGMYCRAAGTTTASMIEDVAVEMRCIPHVSQLLAYKRISNKEKAPIRTFRTGRSKENSILFQISKLSAQNSTQFLCSKCNIMNQNGHQASLPSTLQNTLSQWVLEQYQKWSPS